MRPIWIVVQYVVRTTLQKRSFWVMTFLFPAMILAFNVGGQVLASRTSASEDLAVILSQFDSRGEAIAYVDEAGLLQTLPPDALPGMLAAYADETAAKAALAAEEIDQYFVIPADYLESGDLLVITREFRPLNVPDDEMLSYAIAYNLTGDRETAVTLQDPTRTVSQTSLAPSSTHNESSPLTFIVPFATMFIFFFLISMSSGYMLQSVSQEKENRTIEVLLVSLRPRELMLGKILGLSVVALLQMVVWFGGGMVTLNRAQTMFTSFGGYTLPTGFVLWAILFFALGYILYASLMGAIGALSPNAREAGQYTFLVMLPLLLPLWLNVAFIQSPNGTIATALSLFPLTAPTAMMTRMAAGGVPVWQTLLSLAGLAVTTYLLVLFAARFFRADTLLSTRSFNWRRLIAEFRNG